jgi:Ca-activated chloride channel family protein
MTMNTNDPRLTAYALGEANAEDQAAVEAALRESPELQNEIDAIRQIGDNLATGFENEYAPALDPEAREQIAASAARTLPFVQAATWHRLLAAPAVITLLVGSITLLQPNREKGSRPVCVNVSRPEPTAAQQPEVRPEPLLCEVNDMAIEMDAPPPASSHLLGAVDTVRSPMVMRSLFVEGSQMPPACASPIAPSRPMVEGEPLPNGLNPLDTEEYDLIRDNPFRKVADHPLSTFSIDVDTASYANIRRMLNQGTLPPPDAVRIEEMINYFQYDYAEPDDEHPFAAHLAITTSPWSKDHQLVRIGIKARELSMESRPAMNLVFLLDVSGSMNHPNKLPLVKRAMKMLVQHLDERDRIAIVVYAGASGLVLPSTACDNDQAILDALDRLEAGGSTNGGAGIELAYATALKHMVQNGVNRVILCTDGDFNVGTVQTGDLVRLVEQKAKDGIFLSVLGFGMGNYKDATLEQLADKGNGNYAYIDTFNEARKVLVDQLTGTLVTVAKDVKIQVEFNPAHVAGYRLIGYENRMLNKEDFNDDTKDAGEIGAGHTVTALYEIVPVGKTVNTTPGVDPLRYQAGQTSTPAETLADEILTVKLRYKAPDGDTSTPLAFPLKGWPVPFEKADDDIRFASAVAAFGLLLRDSPHKGDATYERILEIASKATGKDRFGYRREFIELVRNAQALGGKQATQGDRQK